MPRAGRCYCNRNSLPQFPKTLQQLTENLSFALKFFGFCADNYLRSKKGTGGATNERFKRRQKARSTGSSAGRCRAPRDLLTLYITTPALAASIVPVSKDDTGAEALAEAMMAKSATLQGAKFATIPPYGEPHGVSNALSFFPTDGDDFGIMTTGDASFANAENTGGSAGASLGGQATSERGNTAYDVSVLELDLLTPAKANCLRLDFAFYSEEYPEYVGSSYNDSLIAELDQSTWKTSNSVIVAPDNFAFDSKGEVVSINSTGDTGMNETNSGGTTYDGATTLLEAATEVNPGEEHKLYLSIFDQGDQVLDSAAFVDNIRFEEVGDPKTDCKPGAKPVEGRTPLIIVPGAGGSELVDATNNDKELWMRLQELYDSSSDEHLRDLKLDESGNSQGGSDVRAKDIIREVSLDLVGPVPGPFDNVSYSGYITTMEALTAAGYEEGKDLFVFPYDFRKEVEGTTNYEGQTLVEKIDEVLDDTGASQVDVMAHSMGGLVTLDTLRQPESAGKVRKVITLGTPVLGATKGLSILQYQMPCFIETPYVPICLSDRAGVQELMDTLPGAHLLLPSPDFDDAEGAPLVIDHNGREDGRAGEQGYDGWSGILREDPARNDRLIQYAKEFHEANDDLYLADPSVQLVRGVGDSVATVDSIREYEYEDCSEAQLASPCTTKIGHEINKDNGDMTVPLHSADLHNPDTGFDKRGENDHGTIPTAYAHDVDHEGLYKNDKVLAFANAYFGGKQQNSQATSAAALDAAEPVPSPREPQDPRTTQQGEVQEMSAQAAQGIEATEPLGLAEELGLSSTPEPFGGIELETRGPVRGFIEDESSNILGNYPGQPKDAIFQMVPGGTYNAISETQTFFLNEYGSYTGKLEVVSGGEARLRVRSYANNEMNGQAVFRVEAPVGANLRLGFATTQDLGSLRLQIDNEGDGTTDKEVAPDSIVTGPAASETNPPTTTATAKTIPPKAPSDGKQEDDDDEAPPRPTEATVTLTAEDGPEGSGVAASHYFVEGLAGMQDYTAPFTVPLGKSVSFWSIDRAGNAELVQKVLVDDAPNTLKTAEPIASKARLWRYIDPKGDEDWFSFDADGGSTYRVQLHALPADYDLELYDANGKKLVAPAKRGKRAEEVRDKLTAGRYYVRVVGYGEAWNAKLPYHLKLDKLGSPRQVEDD